MRVGHMSALKIRYTCAQSRVHSLKQDNPFTWSEGANHPPLAELTTGFRPGLCEAYKGAAHGRLRKGDLLSSFSIVAGIQAARGLIALSLSPIARLRSISS